MVSLYGAIIEFLVSCRVNEVWVFHHNPKCSFSSKIGDQLHQTELKLKFKTCNALLGIIREPCSVISEQTKIINECFRSI